MLSVSKHTPIADQERRYDIDAIRVIAFGLLIFYHVCMFYVADWGWHIKSEYLSSTLQYPMLFLNQWRMALLFAISGIATAILFRKKGLGLLPGRLSRLGIPLVFGMLVVVVPQVFFEVKAQYNISMSYWEFWLAYLGINDWPTGSGLAEKAFLTWNHLWFLPYVLVFTFALIPLALIMRKWQLSVGKVLENLALWQWIMLPLLPLMLVGVFVFPHFPFIDHSLVGDWYALSMYFCFFFFGYLLMTSKNVWLLMAKNHKKLALFGLCTSASFFFMRSVVNDDSGELLSQLFTFVIYLNRWTWILTVLALGYVYFNKPSRWIAYGTSAVFSWYILHQTITVIAGATLAQYQLGGYFEFTCVLVATFIGCFLIHHYVIRPVKFLHPFFGVSSGNQKTNKDAQEISSDIPGNEATKA